MQERENVNAHRSLAAVVARNVILNLPRQIPMHLGVCRSIRKGVAVHQAFFGGKMFTGEKDSGVSVASRCSELADQSIVSSAG
jgi:hypothetical protein